MKTRPIRMIVSEVLEDIDELRKDPGLSTDDKELLDLSLEMISNIRMYKNEGFNPYQE